MTQYHWLLFFHVLGAALLVAGAVVAGTVQFAAMQRELPSEIALLLRLARVGVVLLESGALIVLIFGIWLVDYLPEYNLADSWIAAAIALWIASQLFGGLGGRTARRTRELAERLAAEENRPSPHLKALVAHRPSLLLSYASTAAVVAMLVLMVWKPGAA